MTEVKEIIFDLPAFLYIVGKSDQGKTYYIYSGIVPEAMKHKFDIHYVVNNAFPVEEPLAKQALSHDNVFIHPSKDLNEKSMKNLIGIIRQNDRKKLVIIDNFTYGITGDFLDFITFARKYNTSVIFISHTVFASRAISPRLREVVSYFIFFYMDMGESYKKILNKEMSEIYRDEITSKSYKFLTYDLARGIYSVGKLPEYKIKLKVTDQFKGSKLSKALRELGESSVTETVESKKERKPKASKNGITPESSISIKEAAANTIDTEKLDAFRMLRRR